MGETIKETDLINDTVVEPLQENAVVKLCKYELKRYKQKGYGLCVAILLGVLYFTMFPFLLKHYWPEKVENEGKFYFLLVLAFNHGIFYFVNIEYLIIYKLNLPFFERYKTSPDEWPWEANNVKWREQLKRSFKQLFLNQYIILPIFLLPDLFTNNCPYRMDRQTFPSFFEIAFQLCFCMLIEDFVFYQSHKLLHTNYFYNKVHKVHHEYVEAVSLGALYAHSIEFIFGNLLPSAIAPMILGKNMHFITYIIYMVMVLHETHDGHSGYNFSWSPHRLMPMTFDAEFHIFHHLKFKGNYANYFSIWDKAFGTVNKAYLEFYYNKEKYLQKYLKGKKASGINATSDDNVENSHIKND
jgi:sterol desaturase/sphingolipid hydroxylase (fatty acid hydroxylase superfamily)